MSNQVQRDRICDYCNRHGYITNKEAMMIGIGSPTKRISEMRHMPDYDVAVFDHVVFDDDGKRKTHFFRYRCTKKEVTHDNGV